MNLSYIVELLSVLKVFCSMQLISSRVECNCSFIESFSVILSLLAWDSVKGFETNKRDSSDNLNHVLFICYFSIITVSSLKQSLNIVHLKPCFFYVTRFWREYIFGKRFRTNFPCFILQLFSTSFRFPYLWNRDSGELTGFLIN